ncbi:phosphonate ABC transporter, ATPase subunit [Alkaliphilus metalliredigens QYMF]|uniref:Phosphonate ABC transporter, ATPase subunit n=1 Tax=Alkaliphilus metalliredigens (strain QYMF) TaxID=293826 RepID=A6TMF4_ALKMQ|nr:phosphonate ABC transporter ATP-binding protein [Alkaliphilus metalliredigens]ABR47372.1 phosphonate ABC transporter, ATPase subunit [Alkaliphilus metalliredigens QYMF]
MTQPILQITELSKVYPDGTVALNNVELDFKKGEFVSIIGPSGAGKSTLIRCINRLVEPSGGKIIFKEKDIVKARGKELRMIRRQIGMIFQGHNLVKRSETIRNVLHGNLGYMNSIKGGLGLFTKESIEDAIGILERVGLRDQAFKRADELSGGQQQRVGIARAMAQNPSIIMADEPIASLDPKSSEDVMRYLKKVCNEDGITALVNLHQVDFAKEFSDRIIGVRKGHIVFDGKPSDLNDRMAHHIYN